MAEFNDEVASVTLNIRYPVTCTDRDVFAGIEASLDGTRIGILKKEHEAPLYFEPDDPFVQKLLEAYRKETGDLYSEPIVIGGGTYAKMFRNMLAFGASFPGAEDRMHQPEERLHADAMMKAARIFARALYSLCVE